MQPSLFYGVVALGQRYDGIHRHGWLQRDPTGQRPWQDNTRQEIGGRCFHVCKQTMVSPWTPFTSQRSRVCDENIDLLAVSCRPYYLPREFSNVIVILVYIPPSANAKLATDMIARVARELQSHTPDALVMISGDFNH